MTISMYAALIPVLKSNLQSLAALLKKAEAHATSAAFEPSVLLSSRLFPDMFALTQQVQIATDQAKGSAARLSGSEIPKFDDNETTFAELDARITTWVYPNFFFHMTTAYNILRHNGVVLSKRDFLGM